MHVSIMPPESLPLFPCLLTAVPCATFSRQDLCEVLSELHDRAPTHSFAATRRQVEGAFGRRLEEMFESFEEQAVASGSIAQVRCKGTGAAPGGGKQASQQKKCDALSLERGMEAHSNK
jgi:ABC1 atypical kinase-like domain